MSIAQLNYLNELAKMNVINNILDIGANRGEFSLMCNYVFKTSNIVMVEGNENCRSILEALPFKCFISLLSDDKKEVEFFTNKNNPICTGSSYYKEVTNHYIDAVSKKVQTETLDDLLKDYTEPFDLIKIDTQGSEADIMRGGNEYFLHVLG
jgi:FkbM family methyltransferase